MIQKELLDYFLDDSFECPVAGVIDEDVSEYNMIQMLKMINCVIIDYEDKECKFFNDFCERVATLLFCKQMPEDVDTQELLHEVIIARNTITM